MWASAESQELAEVSPCMHAEFALRYEKELLAPFARNGYGCCEALHRKLEDVLAIPNIWRISMSPWADLRVATDEARRILPPMLSRHDAIYNIGRAALVVQALSRGDFDLLARAVGDGAL